MLYLAFKKVILLIIFAILLVLVFLLLMNPILINVNSRQHIYSLDWKYLMQANLVFKEEEPLIRLRALFWKKDFKILEIQSKKKEKPKSGKIRSNKKKRNFDFQKNYKNILSAIEVKQFYLNVDTGDYVWNAYLYPIAYFLSNQKRQLQVNFQGDVELLLSLKSRPAYLLYAILNNPLK